MEGSDACALSIVICTRNRAKFLGGTLQALANQKTTRSWEVLFVDNASTDDTAEVLAAADDCGGRLRVARCDRIGLGAARDFAWRLCRAPIIAFTDDDCYPEADYVDAVLQAFDDRPAAGVIGGRIVLYDRDDISLATDERETPVRYAPRSYLETGSLTGANLSFRREWLERAGGFDPELGAGTPFPCEDIDAAAAVLWAGAEGWFDPRPVVYHHHRRREADREAMWRSYDAGRGAYYAKYILDPRTRWAYLGGWGRRLVRRLSGRANTQFRAELTAARAYLKAKGRGGVAVAAAPLALLTMGALFVAGLPVRVAKRLGGGSMRAGASPGA